MRVLLIASVLIAATLAFADEISQKCGEHPELYRDSSGSPVWLTPNELEERAISVVRPERIDMPQLHYQGTVSMKVMIGKTGNLICMWDVAGHPIMIPSAVRAAHSWRFRPLLVGGKPREFLGTMKIQVSTKH